MNRKDQEEALEAAKLAAMVGSQLKVVDQLMSDRTNIPANRININNFISQIKGANQQTTNPYTQPPFGQRSPYLSEEQVQQMVPDIVPSSSVQDLKSQMIPLPTATTNATPLPEVNQQLPSIYNDAQLNKNTHINSDINSNELLDSIKNIEKITKSIGNSLESLLELIQSKLN